MEISTATALATAIVALVAPVLTQVCKRYIPSEWVGSFAVAVAVLLGVIAIGATGGFDSAAWGVALAAVVGVSNAVYQAVNRACGGKGSKDAIDAASIAAGE